MILKNFHNNKIPLLLLKVFWPETIYNPIHPSDIIDSVKADHSVFSTLNPVIFMEKL